MPKRARDLRLALWFRCLRRHHHFLTCISPRWNMQWIRLHHGAWRLSMLLLLLWGTIYVSHFFRFVFRFAFSFASFLSSPFRTLLTHSLSLPHGPEFRMCHSNTHTRCRQQIDCIRFDLDMPAICFSIFRSSSSSSACQKRIIETRRRGRRRKCKIAWLMPTCQKGIFPTRLAFTA